MEHSNYVTTWTWFGDEQESLQSQQRTDVSHDLLIKPAPTSLMSLFVLENVSA